MTAGSAPKCVVFGGGDHAAIVIDCLWSSLVGHPAGILDPSLATGSVVHGLPVLGGDNDVDAAKQQGITHFFIGVGGTRGQTPRGDIYDHAIAAGLAPLTTVHPTAIVSESAEIEPGSLIAAGAVIGIDVHLGKNVIINTGAVIDHHSRIGDHSHIATGASLSGRVTVGANSHIGTGASVRQGVTIGAGATVGTGAAVVGDIAEGVTAIGVPAKPA